MKKYLAALAVPFAILAGCGGKPQTLTQSATGSVHPAGWAMQGPPPSTFLSLAPSRTVTMFDSTDVWTVPSDPFAQAGYAGGFWPTFGPLSRRWPRSHTVSIAIGASERADCLDVEPGDATPGEAPGWVWAEKRAGHARPCIYSDWSEYTTQIRPALEHAGIHRWQVWEWDAFYDFRPHIDPGFDGTQYTDRCLGRNLDCSLVSRAFLSIAHPPLNPTPTPKPHPKPKPKSPTRLQKREARRTELRRILTEQHCRVKHPSKHCEQLRRRGALVNREIGALGGH